MYSEIYFIESFLFFVACKTTDALYFCKGKTKLEKWSVLYLQLNMIGIEIPTILPW